MYIVRAHLKQLGIPVVVVGSLLNFVPKSINHKRNMTNSIRYITHYE